MRIPPKLLPSFSPLQKQRSRLLLGNYFFYMLSPLTRSLLGIGLQIPITTYYLNVGDFGIYATVMAVTGVFVALATPAPSWVLSAHYGTAKDRTALISSTVVGVLGFHIALCVPATLIGYVVLNRIIGEVPSADIVAYLLISYATAILNAPSSVISKVLSLKRKAATLAAIEIGGFIASIAITAALLAATDMMAGALFLGQLGQACLTLIAFCMSLRGDLRLRSTSMHWLREVIRIGVPAISGTLGQAATTASERLVIGYSISIDAVAIYTHSQSYRQVLQMALGSTKSVLWPETVDAYATGRSSDVVSYTILLWTFALNLGGAAVAIFAPDVVSLLTHGKFAAAGPYVFFWWVYVAASSIGLPYAQFLLMRQKVRILVVSDVAANVLGIAGVVALTPTLGLPGAFIAAIVPSALLQIYRRQVALRGGCPSVSDSFIFAGIAVNTGLYFLTALTTTAFSIKFFLLSIAILLFSMQFHYARQGVGERNAELV